MVNRLITEGNKIDFTEVLTQIQERDGMVANTYASQVLDIEENGNLRVSMPIVRQRLVPLSKGKIYDACFYTSKGLYQSKVVIIDRFKNDNLYTMEIRLETDLAKYQRRQYYRLEKVLPVYYTSVSEEDYKFITENEEIPESLMDMSVYESGSTVDISGGGLRFVGGIQIERGDKMLVVFEVMVDGQTIKYMLLASVIMSFELPNSPKRFEHRVEFKNISDKHREILIKYIFEEERKIRKNRR